MLWYRSEEFLFLGLAKYWRSRLRLWTAAGCSAMAAAALLAGGAPRARGQSSHPSPVPAGSGRTAARPQPNETCPRFPTGSPVSAPEDLYSKNGVLRVHLALRNRLTADGEMRYCYVNADGSQAPTLRLHPGDRLILSLKNELSLPASSGHWHAHLKSPCGSAMMTAAATNLHFHGLDLPPLCHQDETLGTLLQPSKHAFEYRVRIPLDQPPGLYWYHPHPHGFSEAQVLGGASGALIVEGIERANPLLAGLAEKVLIIRDQKIPLGWPKTSRADEIAYLPERPSKDLSVNFIPVPYPKYPKAVVRMKPAQQQLWRVLNASADTPLDLQLLFARKPQQLGVVALDGVPTGYGNGNARDQIIWQSDIPLPAGGRAEFLVNGPPEGVPATLVTLGVETAPFVDQDDLLPASGADPNSIPADDDDNTPPRPLLTIVASSANQPVLQLPLVSVPLGRPRLPPLASVHPVRQRKLFFSEKVQDPQHPGASTIFYITEEGQTPAPYDPSSATANITAHQGEVEDWIIENRSQELHTFHIHQSHFVVLERDGAAVDEPGLRDTISVRFWDGTSQPFPSVKLRMDFRDPEIVGTFPYHCHILQHEDGGMMGTIQILPALKPAK
jgi:FtsP/CotA-like multicopper oxidase with cupredoxin domain